MKTKRYKPLFIILLCLILIPLVLCSILLTANSYGKAKNILQKSASASLLQTTTSANKGLESAIERSYSELQILSKADAVANYLNNPTEENRAIALDYFGSYFKQTDCWEGLYVCAWDSETLIHSNPATVGKVLREGDSLKKLQDGILSANGVYSAGILKSPSSGNMVCSLYYPIYDENSNPIAFVGGALYIHKLAEMYTDTSALGYDSAYIYIVSKDGIILYHPNADLMGTENTDSLLLSVLDAPDTTDTVQIYNEGKIKKIGALNLAKDGSYILTCVADYDEVVKDLVKMCINNIIWAIIVIVVFSAILLVLIKHLTATLKDIVIRLSAMEQGDVSSEVDLNSNIKEFGDIANSVKNLSIKLTSVTTDINGTMSKLQEAVDLIADSTRTANDSTDGISQAVEEMAKGATETAESVQGTAEQMSEVADNITSIISETDSVSNAVAHTMDIIKDAQNSLSELEKANEETVKTTNAIVEGIEESNEAVNQISLATETITEIASQTNLLSLNASIEAARAGEAGRGFAVVASEIQKLSTQSNEAAAQIQDIIERVLKATDNNSKLVKNISESVLEDNSKLLEVSKSFKNVTECINGVSDGMTNIQTKADNLTNSKNVILDDISTLSSISEENAAATEETAASTVQLGSNIEAINNKAVEIVKLSDIVSEELKFFK